MIKDVLPDNFLIKLYSDSVETGLERHFKNSVQVNLVVTNSEKAFYIVIISLDDKFFPIVRSGNSLDGGYSIVRAVYQVCCVLNRSFPEDVMQTFIDHARENAFDEIEEMISKKPAKN